MYKRILVATDGSTLSKKAITSAIEDLRGVLDGHVILDRQIAERGRYPAINLLKSVSRSLPDAATPDENALIGHARRVLGAWDRAEMMVQAGLYTRGSDPAVDEAIRIFPRLDAFLAEADPAVAIHDIARELAAAGSRACNRKVELRPFLR